MNAPKTTVLSQTKAKQPMSTAALQIVQAAVRENVSISDLSKLALVDPGFALRLLAVVNSAAFKRSSEVRDVQQAALLLGIRGMRNIALSLAVTDLVPLGEGSKVILANSIRRAVSARLIGKALGLRELDGYFTMGLLLESGLLLRAREDLAGAAAIARAPAANRVIHERAAGFVPHHLNLLKRYATTTMPKCPPKKRCKWPGWRSELPASSSASTRYEADSSS